MAGDLQLATSAAGGPGHSTISRPDDVDEREADWIAERVVASAPHGNVQRTHKALAGDAIQTTARPGHARSEAAGLGLPIGGLRSAGAPLPSSTQASFESRFGRDFSGVRVHTGHAASSSARSIQARAYTWGRDIVFGGSEFAPDSQAGQRLLAHELTHVIQQGYAPTPNQGRPPTATPRRIARQADAGVPAIDPADAGTTVAEPRHVGSTGRIDSPGSDAYSRQAACVALRGACGYVLPGGPVEESNIPGYNGECARETNYSGPVIYPSDEECRQTRTQDLVDPEKVRRLESLTLEYYERMKRDELALGDALRVDAALRSAHAALQRGGVPFPTVPEPVAVPPTADLGGPALAFVPALLYVETAGTTAAGTAAAGTAAAGTTAAGTAAAGTTAAGTAAAGTAAAGAAVTVGVVLVAVALAVGVGLSIYYIATLDYARVDPTIPQAVDEAIDTIEATLKTAPRPRPRAKPRPAPEDARKNQPAPQPIPGSKEYPPEKICADEVYDRLKDNYESKCKEAGRMTCSKAKLGRRQYSLLTCEEALRRLALHRECLAAREEFERECFASIDPRHETVLEAHRQGIRTCERAVQEKCFESGSAGQPKQ